MNTPGLASQVFRRSGGVMTGSVAIHNREKAPTWRQVAYLKKCAEHYACDINEVPLALFNKRVESLNRFEAGEVIDYFMREFVGPERRELERPFKRARAALLEAMVLRAGVLSERRRLELKVIKAARSQAKDELNAHIQTFGELHDA